MSPLLNIIGLSKRYGTPWAVRDVNFSVAAGEVVGLLGPNGAGKTTTLECVLGLRTPDEGTIALAGETAGRRRTQSLGAQLQAVSLQDKITPREAIELFGGFHEARVPTSALIERFDLADIANQRFETLSGGQRQRVGLALAFVNNPSLVLLDEPTAGLDAPARRALHELIGQARLQGRGVLLTTHDLAEARSVCDRILVIAAGRLIAQGTPDELASAVARPPSIFVRTRPGLSAEAFADLAGIVRLESQGEDAWQLTASNITCATAAVAATVRHAGVELIDLTIRRPTLEDAYLALVSRVERDRAAPFP